MRSFTAAELAALRSIENKPLVRVSVKDSGGTYRDFSTLSGKNWLLAGYLDFNVDQPIASGGAQFWRGDDAANSLSPLIASSAFAGYLDIGRDIKVEMAVIPPAASPISTDWKLLFEGVIDDYDMPGKSQVWVVFRDHGALLEDTDIETETTYGSEAGVALETVIQQLLNDHLGGGAPSLYVPVSPAFLVPTFTQKRMSVFAAIRALAASKDGWDVRYKYDSGTGTFRLTLYQPPRTKVVPDFVFTAGSDEFAVRRLRADRTKVRNAITVSYNDAAAGKVQSVTVTNGPSIAKYKRRAMPVDATGQPITTSAQATAYGSAILLDLQEPKADREAEMPLFWLAELHDLYEYPPNATQHDSAQQLAAVGIRHEWGKKFRTTIACRGTVAGAHNSWLVLQPNGRVYVKPRWIEEVTKPTELTGRLTLGSIIDPLNRIVKVHFIGDATELTVNNPGPYVFDVDLHHSDPTPVSYLMYYYDAQGFLASELYHVDMPFSGERLLQDFSNINLLDEPGFTARAAQETDYTVASYYVDTLKLGPLLQVGQMLSAGIWVKLTNSGGQFRPRMRFLDAAGATIFTRDEQDVFGNVFPGAGTAVYRRWMNVDYIAGVSRIVLDVISVGAPVGTALVSRPVLSVGRVPPAFQDITSGRTNAVVQAGSIGQAITQQQQLAQQSQASVGVPGFDLSAQSIVDSGNLTVLLDTELRKLQAMQLDRATMTIDDAIGVLREIENIRNSAIKDAQAVGQIAGALFEWLNRQATQVGVPGDGAIASDIYDATGVSLIFDSIQRFFQNIVSIENGAGPLLIGQAAVSDGLSFRPIVKGHVQGRAKAGAVSGSSWSDGTAITFASVFATAPVVILQGGLAVEMRRQKWTGDYDPAKPCLLERVALNVSASGFTPRGRWVQQVGTLTERDNNFAGTLLDTLGEADEATLAEAPAYNDTYRVAFSVTLNVGSSGLNLNTVNLELRFDSSSDGGSNWVERGAKQYTRQAMDSTDENITDFIDLIVSGLSASAPADKIRIRLFSFEFIGKFNGSQKAQASGIDVKYTTSSASPIYASLTPEQDADSQDRIDFTAISVT